MNDGWSLEDHAENFSQQHEQKELSEERQQEKMEASWWGNWKETDQQVQFEAPENLWLHGFSASCILWEIVKKTKQNKNL